MDLNTGIAYTQVWKSVTGIPAEDLTEKLYRAVNYQENQKIKVAAAAGPAIGINYETNGIDEPTQVVAHGYAYCVYGAKVTAGEALEVGTEGKLVPKTAGETVGIAAISGEADTVGTVLLK